MSKNINLHHVKVKERVAELALGFMNRRFREFPIESDNDLDIIMNNDYLCTTRTFGTQSFMVMTIVDGVYYCVNFPVHFLHDPTKMVLFPVGIKIEARYYDNTVIKGIYYNSSMNHSCVFDTEKVVQRQFIFEDIYMCCGHNTLAESKHVRICMMDNIVKTCEKSDTFDVRNMEVIPITRSKLAQLYFRICNNSNNNYTSHINKPVKSVIFYPRGYNINSKRSHNLKTYILRVTGNDTIDQVEKQNKVMVFSMTKDKVQPDVYFLDTFPTSSNQIILARIPDTDCSKRCASWFANGELSVPVACKEVVINGKTKYVPIKLCYV